MKRTSRLNQLSSLAPNVGEQLESVPDTHWSKLTKTAKKPEPSPVHEAEYTDLAVLQEANSLMAARVQRRFMRVVDDNPNMDIKNLDPKIAALVLSAAQSTLSTQIKVDENLLKAKQTADLTDLIETIKSRMAQKSLAVNLRID